MGGVLIDDEYLVTAGGSTLPLVAGHFPFLPHLQEDTEKTLGFPLSFSLGESVPSLLPPTPEKPPGLTFSSPSHLLLLC